MTICNSRTIVSMYRDAWDTQGVEIELEKVIDGIRTGRWRSQIDDIRTKAQAGDVEQVKKLKKDLPCFIAAGTFNKRGNDHLARHAGKAIVDIDHLDSLEEAAQYRDRLIGDPHVETAFISPAGCGVKLIVNVGTCADGEDHSAAVRALADYIATTYSLKIVEHHGERGIDATAEVARMCFVSYDPELRVKAEVALPFTGRKGPEKPRQADARDVTSSAGNGAPPLAHIRAALCHLDPAMPYPEWIRVCMAIKSACPGEDGFRVFDEWSRRAPSDRYGGTQELWDSIKADGGVTVGTLFRLAEEQGWINPDGRLAADLRSIREAGAEDGGDQTEIAKPKPWQLVTTQEVREAIGGSQLARMVGVLQDVTIPPLPLEITLPKALALAGCALSQPIAFDPGAETRRGIELAQASIDTAGGQLCNVWAVIVAPSGTGKDIGNLVVRMADEMGLSLGHSGSAEGLADALVANGGGLLTLSEMQNYLNPKKWEYGATSFLTQAFNGGHAKVALSRRNGGNRDIRYCAPSIIANVQPAVFDSLGDRLLLDTGFLPRFLVSRYERVESWRPAAASLDLQPLRIAFEAYRGVQGRIRVPQGYLQDVLDEFNGNGAAYPGHYNRLINEYGPRIALMLAARFGSNYPLEIAEDHWRRAGVLLRWFYGMAEGVFSRVGESDYVRKMEDRLARMLAFIKKHRKGVDKVTFSRTFCRGSTAEQRNVDLRELQARGRILIMPSGRKTLLMAMDKTE